MEVICQNRDDMLLSYSFLLYIIIVRFEVWFLYVEMNIIINNIIIVEDYAAYTVTIARSSLYIV